MYVLTYAVPAHPFHKYFALMAHIWANSALTFEK